MTTATPKPWLAERQMLLITLGMAMLYFLYGFASNGFYQHDEAAHYLSMRGFWADPNSVLSNWAKPGYKLVYALPALAGPVWVQLVNALLAAFTAFLAYRTAKLMGVAQPAIAFVLLALQPFWVQLSFRNYSELLSAFMLMAALYAHTRQAWLWAALLLSFQVMLRQEFYPIVAVYGVYLLTQRRWLPAFSLATFAVVHHVWGWLATGDALYLVNQILFSPTATQDAWPRQGGEHYFLMALTVFGAAALLLLLVYAALCFTKQLKCNWFIITPMLLYFAAHVAFNVQSIKIGPSTGGNLRYLIVISPLVALCGALAVQQLQALSSRRVLVVVGVGFALITAIYLTYEHNQIKFTEARDWRPLLMVLAMLALVLIPMTLATLRTALWVAMPVFLLLSIRPLKITNEEKTIKQAVKWAERNGVYSKPVLASHRIFFYYLGRDAHELQSGSLSTALTDSVVAAAPTGTLVFWDSHYSYRPQLVKTSLNYDYFEQRKEAFALRSQFVASDNSFGILVYEKLK